MLGSIERISYRRTTLPSVATSCRIRPAIYFVFYWLYRRVGWGSLSARPEPRFRRRKINFTRENHGPRRLADLGRVLPTVVEHELGDLPGRVLDRPSAPVPLVVRVLENVKPVMILDSPGVPELLPIESHAQ